MRVFFDTNILLDVVLKRDDKALTDNAIKVLSAAKELGMERCVAAITIPTVAYVLKKMSPQERKALLAKLLEGLDILSSKASHVESALKGGFNDIEDAMQYACALENKCDLIITRDVHDYAPSRIPIMSPSQFLSGIGAD